MRPSGCARSATINARHRRPRCGTPGAIAKGRRIGVEYSSCGLHITQGRDAKWIDIEPDLYRLRRRKDADELARLKRAIAATAAMYARAREIMMPGINELDVFSELQAPPCRVCGEMLTGTGNDYASGVRGGLPRNRKIEAGELYILDLGPAYRGYYADNCRVIAVNHEPTEVQRKAWEQVRGAVSDHRTNGQARRPLPTCSTTR